MMKDQFIFEKLEMGCWHDYEWINRVGVAWQCRCGHEAYLPIDFLINPDFSTWEGFGKLWEAAKEKEWWKEFLVWLRMCKFETKFHNEVEQIVEYIHPTRFRDELADFLPWEGE